MGENQSISADQIQSVLGSEQVNALATKIGVDPSQVSHFLAEYLPKVVDKLTPEGKVDPTADHQQGLVDLLPSLRCCPPPREEGSAYDSQGCASRVIRRARRNFLTSRAHYEGVGATDPRAERLTMKRVRSPVDPTKGLYDLHRFLQRFDGDALMPKRDVPLLLCLRINVGDEDEKIVVRITFRQGHANLV